MPIFRLSPVPALLDDPRWQVSSYRDTAWANTATEREARQLMSGRFDLAGGDLPAGAQIESPWLDARLVLAEPAVPPNGIDIPAGQVLTERAP